MKIKNRRQFKVWLLVILGLPETATYAEIQAALAALLEKNGAKQAQGKAP